jgi:FAD/FMN-containing dehydrogenase
MLIYGRKYVKNAINFAEFSAIAATYGPMNFFRALGRFEKLKTQYDPGNVFSFPQSIR